MVDGFKTLRASFFFSYLCSFSHFILSGVRENGCDFYVLCYCSIHSFGCFGKERARMEERGVIYGADLPPFEWIEWLNGLFCSRRSWGGFRCIRLELSGEWGGV